MASEREAMSKDIIIEESGPVQYDEQEDEDEEDKWGGGEIEEMVYEGDPLLNSDYEGQSIVLHMLYLYNLLYR